MHRNQIIDINKDNSKIFYQIRCMNIDDFVVRIPKFEWRWNFQKGMLIAFINVFNSRCREHVRDFIIIINLKLIQQELHQRDITIMWVPYCICNEYTWNKTYLLELIILQEMLEYYNIKKFRFRRIEYFWFQYNYRFRNNCFISIFLKGFTFDYGNSVLHLIPIYYVNVTNLLTMFLNNAMRLITTTITNSITASTINSNKP